MITGLVFTLGCLFPLILIDIVYMLQERRKNTTTTSFKLIIFANILMDVFEIVCSYCLYEEKNIPLGNILLRLHWVFGLLFFYTFFLYIYAQFKKINNITIKELLIKDKFIVFMNVFTFLLIVIMFIIPLPKEDYYNLSYLPGWLAYILVIYAMITFAIDFIILIKNKKRTKEDIRTYIILITIASLYVGFQYLFKNIAFGPLAASFLIITIYLTVENPNIYLINETNVVKNNIDNNNYILTNYIGDIKLKVNNELEYITSICNKYNDLNNLNINEFNKDLNIINNHIDNALLNITNKTVFINNSDRIIDSINLANVFSRFNKFANNKLIYSNVKLSLNIDNNVPSVIQGNIDIFYYILTTSFMTALKQTEVGRINIIVQRIDNYLLIRIIDTGSGRTKEEYANILNIDSDYLLLYNYLKSFNGYLNISGQKEVGTTLDMYLSLSNPSNETIILNNIISEDNNIVNNEKKKVLLVENNNTSVYCLTKIFSKHNFEVETVNDLNSVMNKIKMGIAYDYIFVDLLINDSEYDIGKSIKELSQKFNYSIPLLVALLPYKSIRYEKQYLNNGYDYCLPMSIDNDEINKFLSSKK